MTDLEKILEYQQEDAKLIKLEREIASSSERKNFAQAVNFVTKAAERLDVLEDRAAALDGEIQKLKKSIDETTEVLDEFNNLDEMLEGGADISFYKKNIAQITERLKTLKGEIASLTKALKSADEEFQALYQKRKAVLVKGKEYREIYENYKAEKKLETDGMARNLEKLAAGIPADIMKRYQIKKSEHIFPVLCPANGDRCSKCGYELSLVGKEKISSGGIVECENCHRVLYKAH